MEEEEEEEEEEIQRRPSACSQYPPCLVEVDVRLRDGRSDLLGRSLEVDQFDRTAGSFTTNARSHLGRARVAYLQGECSYRRTDEGMDNQRRSSA